MLPNTSSQEPGAGMWLQESHGHALRPQTTRPCSEHNRLRGEPPTQATPILLLLGMLLSLGTPPMGKRLLCQITVQTPSTHVASSPPAESQLVCSSDSQTACSSFSGSILVLTKSCWRSTSLHLLNSSLPSTVQVSSYVGRNPNHCPPRPAGRTCQAEAPPTEHDTCILWTSSAAHRIPSHPPGYLRRCS